MTNTQLRLLNQMKSLIKQGKMRFENNRRDRDYQQDLFEIGISEYEAWYKYILFLNSYDYVIDYRPSYKKSGDALIFKKIINNYNVYIKLKIENDMTVCLSFHKDDWRNNYDM